MFALKRKSWNGIHKTRSQSHKTNFFLRKTKLILKSRIGHNNSSLILIKVTRRQGIQDQFSLFKPKSLL